MISLEKARELKEAGLAWVPKQFDFYHNTNNKRDEIVVLNKQAIADTGKVNLIWLPSLSQLLAEIEARGYWWELRRALNGKYRIMLYLKVDGACALGSEYGNTNDTPEDAAADALLWILEQEVSL